MTIPTPTNEQAMEEGTAANTNNDQVAQDVAVDVDVDADEESPPNWYQRASRVPYDLQQYVLVLYHLRTRFYCSDFARGYTNLVKDAIHSQY